MSNALQLAGICAGVWCWFAACAVQAGEAWSVGKPVPAEQRVSLDKMDHGAWNELLQKYVDEEGRVNYRDWKDTLADRQALDQYLAHLSQASTTKGASQAARLAFWINAYNAVTIRGILREYPTSSIRNHTSEDGYNIWRDLHLVVANERYSLDTIEHDILRKMGEPRIHFAIVCASLGCPRLLNEAYRPNRLEKQLSANARHFFSDPGKFRCEEKNRTLEVSPILNWFAEDFGGTLAEQLQTIAPYLPTEEARALARSGRARVSYLPYDWGLNEQKKAGSPQE